MNPNSTTIPTPQSPNLQSTICNPQSGNPQSEIRNPKSSSLHARGLALFSTLIELAEILLVYFVEILSARNAALPASKFFPLFGKAIGCLTSLGRLRLALARAPQRFTARQMLRLSRACDKIRFLTGQDFDFSPWLSLTPEQLDQLSPKKSPSTASGNLQSSICNLQSENPKSAINSVPPAPATPQVAPTPAIREAAALTLTPTPGATLARICEDLVELASELGLARYGATGFLPPPELHGQLGISPELSRLLTPTQSPSPSQSEMESHSHSQSPSSCNLQSSICNLQSDIPHSALPTPHSALIISRPPAPVNPPHHAHPRPRLTHTAPSLPPTLTFFPSQLPWLARAIARNRLNGANPLDCQFFAALCVFFAQLCVTLLCSYGP